ncbi:hypothetical protein [Candidatus Odyssella thessalonicensis]|uniref:hypothetical protein n=1 Tax=Candidatus Odyssella thessalonicensis TaxID=84647 RepID=UPI000225AF54|nr:hypothetical protein [Candidatus Odyssella thessalonicensis]
MSIRVLSAVSCSIASKTYNVTVATDTPSSPQFDTAGAEGSGYNLRGAILTANGSGNNNITINLVFGSVQTIKLGNHLPMLSNYNTAGVPIAVGRAGVISGNVTLNGGNIYRGFFVS